MSIWHIPVFVGLLIAPSAFARPACVHPNSAQCPNSAQSIGRANLNEAFLATFGQRAPIVRTAQQPIHDVSDPPRLVGTRWVTFDVRPARLVPLGRREYALISYEINRERGHSVSGAIAVSYLEKTASHWTLLHLWPEMLYSGVGGQPANVGAEVHRFGGDPLFMAREAWCGMGECSEGIGVIRLSRNQPVAYSDVLAGATSPTAGAPILDFEGNTCQNYDLRARVEPPRESGALFSMRYDGWTSPPGALSPKTPLDLLTSYVPEGVKLVMKPVVPVPTCGR